MSPKTGRPPIGESSKDKQYRLRMSDGEFQKLNYCCEVLGLAKSEVMRQGLEKMYDEAQKQK